MPVMPRVKGKATKIAWAILGKPLVFGKPSKTSKQRKEDKVLSVQETSRVR
jgi:hypothetical protein